MKASSLRAGMTTVTRSSRAGAFTSSLAGSWCTPSATATSPGRPFETRSLSTAVKVLARITRSPQSDQFSM